MPSAPQGRPSVTAVVTAYNYGRFLSDCVDSALSQEDVDARVVVIDDCSSDETPRVTSELCRDPRVTAVRNDANLGLVRSFNKGMELVESEYVVKLDADDLLPPGAWARATALLELHPEVALVYGQPLHFSTSAPDVAPGPAKSWTIWAGHDWVACRCQSGANVISQPEVVVRTAALREAGGLSTEGPAVSSDMNLWLRLAAIGDVARINGTCQGFYRVHEASMLRTISAGKVRDLQGRRGAFDAAFAATAGTLPDARALHLLARRSLAATALDEACRAFDRGHTEDWPVEDLVAFALTTCSDARRLDEWTRLEHRRSVGADRAKWHPQFFADAVARRISDELRRRYWLRCGEW
ncbi:MAG TPA: glycosyltransferase family A protein [Solirubrobacteraceae bacterium]|nr:glycosyltransferase family A protein [Solirubrobacteraceae bacterium]